MDLKHLSCFLEVAEHKNFTVAAKKMHYSVSTVTQYVHVLEEELGFELFDRSSRPLKLTDAGLYFYEQTVDIPGRMDRIMEASRKIAHKNPGRTIIGFLPEEIVLLETLKAYFREQYPNHLLSLRQFSPFHKVEALLKGECDVMFCRTDPMFYHERLVQRHFMTTRLCCRVPADHPLADRDIIRFEDLNHETVVIMPTGTHSEQQVFEQKFYELCPDLTLLVFEHYSKADSVARAQKCILLCYEHMIHKNLTWEYKAIEFELANENSYSLISRVEKK